VGATRRVARDRHGDVDHREVVVGLLAAERLGQPRGSGVPEGGRAEREFALERLQLDSRRAGRGQHGVLLHHHHDDQRAARARGDLRRLAGRGEARVGRAETLLVLLAQFLG